MHRPTLIVSGKSPLAISRQIALGLTRIRHAASLMVSRPSLKTSNAISLRRGESFILAVLFIVTFITGIISGASFFARRIEGFCGTDANSKAVLNNKIDPPFILLFWFRTYQLSGRERIDGTPHLSKDSHLWFLNYEEGWLSHIFGQKDLKSSFKLSSHLGLFRCVEWPELFYYQRAELSWTCGKLPQDGSIVETTSLERNKIQWCWPVHM